ncbi:MAG TPA: Sec-independent protein translocase protein TatB [Sphingomonas sp.]|nr:Sec-independent protein translocase protein TatB [Sphingomonas sp.]
MFDIGSPELLLVAVVAIVVIGPKDLPKAMRVVGYWVGKARGTMRQFRAGFDAMVREAELAEMEKKWAEENKRIMAAHPPSEPEPAVAAESNEDAPPAMTEKPAVHDEPELPLAPAPESRAQ